MVQSSSHARDNMSAPAGITVEVRGVSKRFGTGERNLLVLDRVDLTVQAGEFVSIVGPSGCGKSTLLNVIAGLDQPSSGQIVISGRAAPDRLRDPSPRRKKHWPVRARPLCVEQPAAQRSIGRGSEP